MVMYIFPFRARVVCRVIISLGRVRTKLLHVTFTGKFFISKPRTPAGPAYTQMQIQHRSRAPGPPYISRPRFTLFSVLVVERERRSRIESRGEI